MRLAKDMGIRVDIPQDAAVAPQGMPSGSIEETFLEEGVSKA